MSISQDDPWETAETPPTSPSKFFGQIQVEVWWCILEKGIGKKPFNPNVHKISDRRTAIRLTLHPLTDHNIQSFDIRREYISEFGAWPKITLPSIKNAGLSPRALDGQWVCFELVPEGRTYISKNTGETKESTTFKLVAVYPDEQACRTAYYTEYGGMAVISSPQAQPRNDMEVISLPQARPQNDMDSEKATAYKFLQLFVKGANGDLNVLAQKIASNKVIGKYFTIDSPEVIELMTTTA